MILDTASRNGRLDLNHRRRRVVGAEPWPDCSFNGFQRPSDDGVWSIIDDTNRNLGPYGVGLTLVPFKAPIEGAQTQHVKSVRREAIADAFCPGLCRSSAAKHHMFF